MNECTLVRVLLKNAICENSTVTNSGLQKCNARNGQKLLKGAKNLTVDAYMEDLICS